MQHSLMCQKIVPKKSKLRSPIPFRKIIKRQALAPAIKPDINEKRMPNIKRKEGAFAIRNNFANRKNSDSDCVLVDCFSEYSTGLLLKRNII